MSDSAAASVDRQERELQSLLRAIASRDQKRVLRLLAESPQLARLKIRGGATREDADSYFLKEISHYVYAGDTALHIAAAAHQPVIVEDLISKGADVSSRNRRGAEPLHYAADGSPGSAAWDVAAQEAVVECLIRAGADPNVEDKSGVYPLHRAVRMRCTGTVRALVKNGADPRRMNKSGSTPLHLAVQNTGHSGSGSEASRDEQAKIIRLLLEYGARPSDKDAAGKTVRDCVKADWILALLGDA